MKQTRLLFIDRDGTLIQEPEDEQIDSFEKLVFTKGVFRNLAFIAQHTDYELVMVSNQDGLGTDSFPEDTFWPVHNFIIQTLESEGIHFAKQHIDRHFPEDNSPMRKQTVTPDTGYDGMSQVTVEAVPAGYIGSGVTKKAAATYTPKSTDQVIAAGQYLSGTQTIKGDANLVGGNILAGKSIFGVAGTVVIQKYYIGSSEPSSSTGSNGDLYLQTGG